MGDKPGHEFHGNQYGSGTPAQEKAVATARRELAGGNSEKSRYLAKNGQTFFPSSDGPEVPEGSQHRCYANAERAARADSSLTYVEGVAIANTGYKGSLELTNHAWVVDEEGRVGDPTPTNYKIVGYVGVKILTSELPDKLERGETALSVKVKKTTSEYAKNPPRRVG